jgi:hypothetical protein
MGVNRSRGGALRREALKSKQRGGQEKVLISNMLPRVDHSKSVSFGIFWRCVGGTLVAL